jgi:hypothetical protein
MTGDLSVRGREAIADWIETTLVARGTRQIGSDALFEFASSEVGASMPQVNLGLHTMKLRSDLLGNAYPFFVHDLAVRALPGAALTPYVALLYLTSDGVARQVVHRASTSEMEVLFERITELALRHLWGDGGRSLRFGWPSDAGRPPEFHAAISWLADKMGIASGVGYRPPMRKDGGVDVVAWRPFADRRSGFPIVLAQCTLQADLVSKATDVDTRVWASWLVLDVDPVTALAVPQTIPPGVLWDQLALRCMVFDRIRIAGLLPQETTVEGLASWVKETSAVLSACLEGAEV